MPKDRRNLAMNWEELSDGVVGESPVAERSHYADKFEEGVSSHCTKKEPQALYAPGASPELCLNLGFWAGRQGVGDGGCRPVGLIK